MKKILFIHPSLVARGAEKVLVDLLNKMDQSKYDITLYTFFEEGIHKDRLSQFVKHKFLFKKVFRGWSVFQKIFSAERLFNFLIKDKYDVIISFLEGVPTRVVGGCSEKSTKTVAWVHTDLVNFGVDRVFRSNQEMQNIYNSFDKVVGVSQTAIKSLITKTELQKSKTKVIYNVLDTDVILENGQIPITDVQLDEDVVNICTVGSLTIEKGYLRLLKAVGDLVEKGHRLHLYIVGTGPEEKELKKYIENNELKKYVTLLGFRKNPHTYVKHSDLFVCSSFAEGFSTAVTEAVLLETPVLTTDCSGMKEILEDSVYGLIVENTDQALFEGLDKFLSDHKMFSHYQEKVKERSLYFQKKDNVVDVEQLIDGFFE